MAEAKPKTGSPAANPLFGYIAAIAGWFVPGLGHLILRRWKKALAYFACIAVLAIVGLLMRGNVFTFDSPDIFDRLGLIADLGNGIFYFLAHAINPAGPDVAHAAGDYGTRLIATAGVLNFLCILEAFQIGSGQNIERTGVE